MTRERQKKTPSGGDNTAKAERIAKVMARAGLCSRREAERWIADGRVTVNGKLLDSPAVTIGPDDKVVVDGKPLPQKEKTRLFMFHKPAGLVTTNSDEHGRKTVFDALPEDLPRVMSVGRLDINTEGLLLFTNDGAIARYMELPATGWKRRYRVRVHGDVSAEMLQKLEKGITYEGVQYEPAEVSLDSQSGQQSWLTISISEGKNREIRNMMTALDLQVSRLIRVSYGPFQLGKLPRGAVKEIPHKIIKDQLAAAGVT